MICTWKGQRLHGIQTDDNKVFRMYMTNRDFIPYDYMAISFGKPVIRIKYYY